MGRRERKHNEEWEIRRWEITDREVSDRTKCDLKEEKHRLGRNKMWEGKSMVST